MTRSNSAKSKVTPPKQQKPRPAKPEELDGPSDITSQREHEPIGAGCYRRLPTTRD